MAFERDYSYNNLTFTICTSEQEHFKLENDSDYFKAFIEEHRRSLEVDVSEKTEDEKSTWNKRNTLLFLSCLSEKKDLRNSRVKKKDIWSYIRKHLNATGSSFDDSTIKRKFRNMKSTYKVIKDNKRKTSTGRGAVKWEYFEAMEDIFQEDKTINIGYTIASMPSTSKQPPITPRCISSLSDPPESESVEQSSLEKASTELSQPSTSTVQTGTSIKNESSTSHDTPCAQNVKNNRAKQLYGLRKKQIELEQSRIEELRLLRKAVEDNNRSQEERNNILRQLLEK